MKEELKSVLIEDVSDKYFQKRINEFLETIESDSLLSVQYQLKPNTFSGSYLYTVLLIYKVTIKEENGK